MGFLLIIAFSFAFWWLDALPQYGITGKSMCYCLVGAFFALATGIQFPTLEVFSNHVRSNNAHYHTPIFLQMRISNIPMLAQEFYQWQMQVRTQMVHSSF
jgi:hypothetical protein